MSAVQIVTLVVVGIIVLGCLAFFLSDLWKMRKALDRAQPMEQRARTDERPSAKRKSQVGKDKKGNRLKVIK
ncbi:hypothetical protein [Acidaminobacter hydrogenoformans]|uniref:Uncharacterized protein n=1 Tax=Acidaminobacter hydrogenoformans DSM 2784 TaxID=1120920 RepID=A0A1G5RZN5_9FIRM|nr:hypothetical protein [Acidaminobacter hydrogenoformans]SCZ79230.1 hypothetical protein SAMN03080599_01658 [Acidaminobacter hydrogenoformans DSM 2784]